MGKLNVKNQWSRGYVEWYEGQTVLISVVFSWLIEKAQSSAILHKAAGYKVKLGGPTVMLNPTKFTELGEIGEELPDTIVRHNPNATLTSRGCIRQCKFCAVPKMEDKLQELTDWPIRPVVCDNNLLACSRKHFDSVIDKLKPLSGIDFNQGLDARLLTKYHADRLAELDFKCLRLAWDHTKEELKVRMALLALNAAGIPNRKIHAYVLIGFDDTPEDALYRLTELDKLKVLPNPMRYHPLDCLTHNRYVGKHWTEPELTRFMRYWSNLNYLNNIPFNQFYPGNSLPDKYTIPII